MHDGEPQETEARLLRLSPQDNVLTLTQGVAVGETLWVAGRRVPVRQPLPLGHKVAATDLRPGDKVVKYGVPIGSATAPIAAGDHVHTHNLRSDYLPTYTHATQDRFFHEQPAPGTAAARVDGFGAVALGDRAVPAAGSGRLPAAAGVCALAGMGPPPALRGFLRADGRKGIRNVLVVVSLVECAHHVAREVASPFRERGVHLIGFGGCYPNAYAHRMLERLCTHPNVGGVLLVSLGCESFNRAALADTVRRSARPVQTLVIQDSGGTRASIREGCAWVERQLPELAAVPRVAMRLGELVVGTICGGSDATSGITANPAMGRAFDLLVAQGATAIFEETGELIGCEQIMAARAARVELRAELVACVQKAARHYATLGHGSFAPGNAEGGLSTVEEKSMGAYSKSGDAGIQGILKPGDQPPPSGLYLLDVVPDGEVRFGFANINDNAEIGELMACGCHLVLFSTGRGSVVGSAIAPVLKVCANPETYRRLADDMDVDAGRILEGRGTLAEVGREVYDQVLRVAAGAPTRSEELGHQEFALTYKTFEPLGPACLPKP